MSQFEQGYGAEAQAAPQAPQQDPMVAAIEQFMSTQDPQIAVQIVLMMAEQMGIQAPEQQAAAPASAPASVPADQAMAQQGAPMMRHGGKMRLYRRGGKI